jgi:hypothetical protein
MTTETRPERNADERTAPAEGLCAGAADPAPHSSQCTHDRSVPCVACDSGRCPKCGKRSLWNRGVNAWMHADATCNAECWKSQP